MIYLFQIFLIGANIAMAAYHVYLMKKEKKIQHGWWGLGYFILAVVLAIIIKSWWLLILSLFIRKVFFDLSFNAFLKRQLFYVSTETTSIIDNIHYHLFGKKSEIYMGIYLLCIVIINVLVFNKIV